MSAGIKLYSNQGALMIDSTHANIALVEKVIIPVGSKAGKVEGNNKYNYYYSGKEPIFVYPLSETYYCGAYTSGWNPVTNRFESIMVTDGDKPLEMMVFDKPSSVNTSGPGLRIYSDVDGSKVFDSRLKYLKVIGEATIGKVVPKGAKWGLLIRERQMHVQPVYTNPGTARGYLFVMLKAWDIFENKIRRRDLLIYAEWFENLAQAPVFQVDPIVGVDPLLVDLKNY